MDNKKTKETKQDNKEPKQEKIKSTKVASTTQIENSTKSELTTNTQTTATSTTQTTSSSKQENKGLYTAKNLTDEQKAKINEEMYNFLAERAEMGNMAFYESAGGHGTGVSDCKDYIYTSDGSVLFHDAQYTAETRSDFPVNNDINIIGSGIFYKHIDGLTGNQDIGTGAAYGASIANDTKLDRYVWADNGQVYELKDDYHTDKPGKTVG